MGVRPGYQQTEVGVIPEDWDVRPLKEISPSQSVGLVVNPSSYFDERGTVPMLVGSNITANRIHWGSAQRISHTSNMAIAASRLAAGDLITVRVGEPGVTAVVPPELDGCNCASVMIVRQRQTFDSYWLCYVMNSAIGLGQVKHVQYGTAQKQFNISDAVDFLFPVPSHAEQEAIAEALSDADALIESLEQLCAKKRRLKQGAMQELLTGKKRLPGFSGKWEVKALGEIATANKGRQLSSSLMTEHGRFAHLNGGVSPSGYTDGSNTPGDSIAISEGGNSCGYVQFMFEPYWSGGHCYSVIPNGVDNRFLYHALKGEEPSIMGLRVGSGLPNVQKTALLALNLRCPKTSEEQAAIAAALSDMDAEIAALEAKLAKVRSIKQGMMQELLTGRIRLV